MCRFSGSRHRDYSPSRSARKCHWRRLPTIYEATDVEMAKENDVKGREKELERKEVETEQVLGENTLPPPLKTKSKSARKKCRVFLGKPDVVETNEAQFQQFQDEWSFFLRTPYADFFQQNLGSSVKDAGFSSPADVKKKPIKSVNTELQVHQCSEIAAWLEFFG